MMLLLCCVVLLCGSVVHQSETTKRGLGCLLPLPLDLIGVLSSVVWVGYYHGTTAGSFSRPLATSPHPPSSERRSEGLLASPTTPQHAARPPLPPARSARLNVVESNLDASSEAVPSIRPIDGSLIHPHPLLPNTKQGEAGSPRSSSQAMYGPASGGGGFGGGGGGRGDMGGQIIGPGGGPGGRGKPRLLTPKGQMAGMNAPPPLSSLPPRTC